MMARRRSTHCATTIPDGSGAGRKNAEIRFERCIALTAASIFAIAIGSSPVPARAEPANQPATQGGRDAEGSLPPTESIIDRAFGYQIGDLVRQTVVARASVAGFEASLLPEPGIVNSWLTLRRVETSWNGDARLILLEYQVTSASPEVSLIFLPPVLLKSSERTLARVDAQPVTVSPIIGQQPFQRSGLGDLRLDRRDAPAPTQALWRLQTSLLAALAALGATIYWRRQRRLGRDGPAPFAQARHELKQLLRSGRQVADDEPAAAYRILHRAFDRSAGRSVFREDVGAFVDQQPSFAGVRQEIADFFDSSRAIFFSSGSPPTLDADALLSFAERLASMESRT